MSGGCPTLLAFDFDGTLAAICDDPAAVRIERGAAALLAEASQTEGVIVAVVSGRDADDLTMRVGTPGAYIVGSHGLEVRAPGGLLVCDAPPLSAEVDPELMREVERAGMRLERKKHAVALHWRGLKNADDATDENAGAAIDRVAALFRDWARSHDLDLIAGRCVLEARCAGSGKEAALRWLAGAVGAHRVIYAGDDVTDFGPLRFAAERGRALFVASPERVPPPGVTVVGSFRELFRLVREEVMM